MRTVSGFPGHFTILLLTGLLAIMLIPAAGAGTIFRGHVLDLEGRPLPQAMVSFVDEQKQNGADYISVFTDQDGAFVIPGSFDGIDPARIPLTVHSLGYRQLHITAALRNDKNGTQTAQLTVLVQGTPNYAAAAPASAWLARLDAKEKEHLVNSCVGCHQVPAPEVRAYAKLVASVTDADPAEVRRQSWAAMVKYMNFISAEEFGRGVNTAPPDANRVYAVGDGEVISGILSSNLTGTMETLEPYHFGAPLAVTPATVIREYVIPHPNAVREALMLGTPPRLFVVDVSSNRIFSIDVATGNQKILEVPTKLTMGPHSLHRGTDGSLWVTPFFPTVVAHLDPDSETWETWPLQTLSGQAVGIHDLSFGHEHELLKDRHGRIWYSDISNNAVGYLDPDSGEVEIFQVPEIPGRPGKQAALYGLVMTSDRQHIWYSQLGIGSFGSFNVETLTFETSVQLPSINSGPRRLSISDTDILYVPLYGAGRLIEYDTRANRQIGLYDLPDRASAPYAVTWDPVRKVVWIATSNGDVIYRFDPRNKQFGVIPLPRAQAFLRMVDVDPDTGVLITAYANIVENVHGPRMALIIDPGDGAYRGVDRRVAAGKNTDR
jgi:streptogramin lyase